MELATYKDNQKKNWALDNISTKLQTTGKLSKYVEIFGSFSDLYCVATVCSYKLLLKVLAFWGKPRSAAVRAVTMLRIKAVLVVRLF